MHVVVVGCGRVGTELAVALEAGGHTVAIIDKNARAFRSLPGTFSGTQIQGFGFDRERLAEAGIERADALAAVTNGDNTNVLTARIAKETYEVAHVVARIYDPRRAVIYQRLGIATVATVSWTTDQVMRRLFPAVSALEWSDATGSVSLIERDLPAHWAGRRVADLGAADRFRPVALTRGGQARLCGPDLIGQEGDVLHLAVRSDARDELDQRFASGGAASESTRSRPASPGSVTGHTEDVR
ncbi:MAG: potassium channel family protein [Acidimicrobiales bacterium]